MLRQLHFYLKYLIALLKALLYSLIVSVIIICIIYPLTYILFFLGFYKWIIEMPLTWTHSEIQKMLFLPSRYPLHILNMTAIIATAYILFPIALSILASTLHTIAAITFPVIAIICFDVYIKLNPLPRQKILSLKLSQSEYDVLLEKQQYALSLLPDPETLTQLCQTNEPEKSRYNAYLELNNELKSQNCCLTLERLPDLTYIILFKEYFYNDEWLVVPNECAYLIEQETLLDYFFYYNKEELHPVSTNVKIFEPEKHELATGERCNTRFKYYEYREFNYHGDSVPISPHLTELTKQLHQTIQKRDALHVLRNNSIYQKSTRIKATKTTPEPLEASKDQCILA